MIDSTLPLAQLTNGLARCVREHILPNLTDPWARLQAEQLATVLDALPDIYGPATAKAIRRDSDAVRAWLEHAGVEMDGRPEGSSIDALMAENSALKGQLAALADQLRAADDKQAEESLGQLQRFLMQSLAKEFGAEGEPDENFASLTSRDSQARDELK